MDMKKKKTLTKNIIKASSNIRKKFSALRSGKVKSEQLLQSTLQPVSAPLKEIAAKLDREKKSPIKLETKQTETVDYFTPEIKKNRLETWPFHPFVPTKIEETEDVFKSYPEEDVFESYPEEEEEEQNETPKLPVSAKSTARQLMAPPQESAANKFALIAENYFTHLKDDIDVVYGPRKEGDEWLLGNLPLGTDGDNLIIGDIRYKGTPGLFALLFMKDPISYYDENDLSQYKLILKQTNAHRRNYDSNQQIKGSKSKKYVNIISKLFPIKQAPSALSPYRKEHGTRSRVGARSRFGSAPTFGTGLMRLNRQEKEYIYWDDPNELVSRLRLLIASQQAGHTGHQNEIISIIEELKEADIIE